jgi:hypothetical protein
VPAIDGVASRVCHGVGVGGREGLKTKAVNGKCLVRLKNYRKQCGVIHLIEKCFTVDQVFQV